MTVQTVTHTHASQQETLKLVNGPLPLLPFDNSRPRKTLDFGSDGVVCSVGSLGDLISASVYHPQHGIIVANPFEQFPGGDKFWDSSFVRTYRKKFLDCFDRPGSGFGLKPRGSVKNLHVGYVDGQWPRINYSVNGIEVESAFIVTGGKDPVIVNSMTLVNTSSERRSIDVEFGGMISVHRASYGQLTEAGPVPIPPCLNRARYSDGSICIDNPNLPAWLDCALYSEDIQIPLDGATTESSEPISLVRSVHMDISPWTKRDLTAIYRLRATPTDSKLPKRLDSRLKSSFSPRSGFVYRPDGSQCCLDDFVIRRTLDYILSCCCIPIGNDAICVLTDHIALPLGWHRDNYGWQMKFLRTVKDNAGRLFTPSTSDPWVTEIDRILYGHLVWIYDHAERTTEGFWGRSYLANGKLKDRHVFQLDQQCYPLLELAEFLESAALEPSQARQWGRIVDEILQVLLTRKAADKWVFQTCETPGDDPVSMQYHFSSNVLVWHTLRKLAPHAHTLGMTTPIHDWIDQIHVDTIEAFTTTYNNKPIFAYLCDLEGSFEIYHDANDLPSVFAPEWSFCSSDDPRWLNLFKFAFSSKNERAYFPEGEYHGLGSVHTTHPWPLGDAQEMIFARICGDKEQLDDAKERALKKMQWDGGFAEANDEVTGEVRSKHWFSWPGSVIGTAFIEWSS